MADIFKSQDVNTIQKRLVDYIKQKNNKEESTIEGTFSRDLINANAEEYKNTYHEMDLIRDAAFASTSWGIYLTARCADFGIDRKTAVKAHGEVTITGQPRAWIPARSLFQSLSGLKYYTTEETYIDEEGTVIVPVEAETAGTKYNIEANQITLIPMSIGGVSSVNNEKPMIDGFDEESDESLYQRYSDYIRLPATSGNVYHYNNWTTSVAGVGGCKVTENAYGAGTVGIAVVDSNGNPASADLIQKVKDYIESVRPVGAQVTITTPQTQTIDITVSGLIGGGTEEAFTTSLSAYFRKFGFNMDKVSPAVIAKQLFASGYTDYSSISLNGINDSVILNGKLPIVGAVSLNG